jgi:hypothetical protein
MNRIRRCDYCREDRIADYTIALWKATSGANKSEEQRLEDVHTRRDRIVGYASASAHLTDDCGCDIVMRLR